MERGNGFQLIHLLVSLAGAGNYSGHLCFSRSQNKILIFILAWNGAQDYLVVQIQIPQLRNMHTIAEKVAHELVENFKEDNNWRPSDCNTILPNVHWFPLL